MAACSTADNKWWFRLDLRASPGNAHKFAGGHVPGIGSAGSYRKLAPSRASFEMQCTYVYYLADKDKIF
jgi:hypothetical protein